MSRAVMLFTQNDAAHSLIDIDASVATTVLVVLELTLATSSHRHQLHDAVLFTDDPTKWDYVFRNFEACVMDLHTSWQKKRRSKILELETLQEQSILTIKQ